MATSQCIRPHNNGLSHTNGLTQHIGDVPLPKRTGYANLTPWISRTLFVHTYYAYTFVFYMFLIIFYKGYALEYPAWRREQEMAMVMFMPLLMHAHFYFGTTGCEKGSPLNLFLFILCGTWLMWMLMYFLFKQAYIMPLEAKLCFVSAVIVGVEGMCGVVNLLQTVVSRQVQLLYAAGVVMNVLFFLITVVALICFEFTPVPEEEVKQVATKHWRGGPPTHF